MSNELQLLEGCSPNYKKAADSGAVMSYRDKINSFNKAAARPSFARPESAAINAEFNRPEAINKAVEVDVPEIPGPRITKAEMLKILVNIDKQVLKNAGAVTGNKDIIAAEKDLTAVLNTRITDQDIEDEKINYINKELEALGLVINPNRQLGSLWSKIKTAATNVVSTVVSTAVNTVTNIATLPAKVAVDTALRVFGGKAAAMFIYAFIPDNSPILAQNPIVKSKRTKAINALNALSKVAQFKQGYLLKHMRNGIQKEYGVTPEVYIRQNFSVGSKPATKTNYGTPASSTTPVQNPNDPRQKQRNLGTIPPEAIEAGIQVLIKLVPAIVKMFKKEDAPAPGDIQVMPDGAITSEVDNLSFESDPRADEKSRNDSGGSGGNNTEGGGFMTFITSPAGIIVSVVVAGGVIYGVSKLGGSKK